MILRQSSGLLTEAPFGSSRGEIEAALKRLAETGDATTPPDSRKAVQASIGEAYYTSRA